jgi:ribosome-associated protein
MRLPPTEVETASVTASPRAVELALAAAQAAADKIAHDIVVIDVSERLAITDCFVIASADNERQVKAAVDEIEERLRGLDAKPVRREGEREGRWVLLDFIDIVVHVQIGEERAYYSLERLWKDCPAIPFVDRDAARAGAAKPATPPAPAGSMVGTAAGGSAATAGG